MHTNLVSLQRLASSFGTHITLGISDDLNQYMVKLTREINERYGAARVTGLATVFPGESDQLGILNRAFDAGLRGIKLHAHVMRIAIDDPALDPIYTLCVERRRPVLFHAGREPNSRGLGLDTYDICHVSRVRRVLERHPQLILVVPHLGVNETTEYIQLMDEFPNLYLDTTLVLANFFPSESIGNYDTTDVSSWLQKYSDRIMYGTDWPNIPYEWCTELFALLDLNLPKDVLHRILCSNAARVYDIPIETLSSEPEATLRVRADSSALL
jgi:predicted TIM-barrel fold metal-dependent hydrolase